MPETWTIIRTNEMTQHIMPKADLIGHEADEGCVCGPTPTAIMMPEGWIAGWIFNHHALDTELEA